MLGLLGLAPTTTRGRHRPRPSQREEVDVQLLLYGGCRRVKSFENWRGGVIQQQQQQKQQNE